MGESLLASISQNTLDPSSLFSCTVYSKTTQTINVTSGGTAISVPFAPLMPDEPTYSFIRMARIRTINVPYAFTLYFSNYATSFNGTTVPAGSSTFAFVFNTISTGFTLVAGTSEGGSSGTYYFKISSGTFALTIEIISYVCHFTLPI